MKNKINISENIEYIRKLEGSGFEFNELGIEKEYMGSHTGKSSIAIKIVSIFGGFLATLAFLGFLLISGIFDSATSVVFAGSIFVGLAIWLNVIYNKLIIAALSVSAFAIGLCLIVFALSELGVQYNTICVLLILISLITTGITKNYILSFISILIINGSFIYMIIDNGLYSLIHVYNALLLVLLTYVFLNEAKFLAKNKFWHKLYDPIRIGLIFSSITGLIFVAKQGIFDLGIKNTWVSSIITIPLTIYIVFIVAKTIGVAKTKTLYIICSFSILLLIPTAISPAIAGALLTVLLSFLVNYKTGFVIGIVSLVYFISQYYYDLNFTLLTKSIIMLVTGILFLVLYFIFHKNFKKNETI